MGMRSHCGGGLWWTCGLIAMLSCQSNGSLYIGKTSCLFSHKRFKPFPVATSIGKTLKTLSILVNHFQAFKSRPVDCRSDKLSCLFGLWILQRLFICSSWLSCSRLSAYSNLIYEDWGNGRHQFIVVLPYFVGFDVLIVLFKFLQILADQLHNFRKTTAGPSTWPWLRPFAPCPDNEELHGPWMALSVENRLGSVFKWCIPGYTPQRYF